MHSTSKRVKVLHQRLALISSDFDIALVNPLHCCRKLLQLVLVCNSLFKLIFFHPSISLPSAIDCAMSDWTEWSECNKSCGKGHTIRTRVVTMEPQFGGDPCPETIQRKKCKVRKCSRGQGNSDDKKRRKEQREKRRSKQVKTEVTSEHPGTYYLLFEIQWKSTNLCTFFLICTGEL